MELYKVNVSAQDSRVSVGQVVGGGVVLATFLNNMESVARFLCDS